MRQHGSQGASAAQGRARDVGLIEDQYESDYEAPVIGPDGEIVETWRHRGYGSARGMSADPHFSRGNPGGAGAGIGEQRYALETPRRRVLPKGYKRSDASICDEVCERLSRAGVDVSEVTVDVGSGIVTLSGTVPDRRQKYVVEETADGVLGVNEVWNNVRVAREAGSAEGSDTAR